MYLKVLEEWHLHEVVQIGVQLVVDALHGLKIAQRCVDGACRLGHASLNWMRADKRGTHIGVLAVDVAGGLVVEDIVDGILAQESIGEKGLCPDSGGPAELENKGCSAEWIWAH